MTDIKGMKFVYALKDRPADTIANYYVCDSPVWAERYMTDLMKNLRFGVPDEFSMHCVCALDDTFVISGEALAAIATEHPEIKMTLFGGDYVEMENDVQRNV